MNRMLRYGGRAIATVVLLVVIGFALLVAFSRTEQFNRILQARLAPYLAHAYRGQIEIGSIQGSLWGGLILGRVTLRYRGGEVIRIPRVDLAYSLVPLIWHTFHLRVTAYSPVANIARDPGGNWNLLEAIKPAKPSSSSTSSNLNLLIDSITITDGIAEIRAGPGPASRLLHLELQTGVTIASDRLDVNVRKLTATLATAAHPLVYIDTGASFERHRESNKLTLSNLHLSTDRSAIAISGTALVAGTIKLKARLSVDRIAAPDLAAFFPGSPVGADLTGKIQVEGPGEALTSIIELEAAGAKLHGTAVADIVSKIPAISTNLKLEGADLQRLVHQSGLAGVADGDFTIRTVGFTGDKLSGRITLRAHKLIIRQYDLGEAQAALDVANGNLKTSASSIGPAGAVVIGGTSNLSRDPHYRFKLVAQRYDFARAVPHGGVATNLNLEATADGHGFTIDALDTRVTANLRKSQIAGATFTRGDVDARIVRGQAQISRARFDLAGAGLVLSGVGGLSAGSVSDIKYSIEAPSIAQLLKLARVNGDGRLRVEGTVRGPNGRLRTRGDLNFAVLRYGPYQAQSGRLSYDLLERPGPLPAGSIELDISELRAGLRLRTLSLRANAPAKSARAVDLMLDARDERGRTDHVALTLEYASNLIAGRLNQAEFGLDDGRWALTAPVNFKANPHGVTIGNLRMQNGARDLSLEGALSQSGPQRFNLKARGIDPALLGPFLPPSHRYEGEFTGSLRVSGTAARPIIDAQALAAKIAVDRHRVGDLSAVLGITESRAQLDATLREDQGNAIRATAAISAAVAWTRGLRINTGNDLDLRLFSSRLELGRIGALMPDTLRNFEGLGAIDLRLQGAPAHPVPTGYVSLAGIKGDVVPIGVALSEAHGRVEIDPQEVKIVSLSAQAAGGKLTAAGAIAIRDYAPGAVQIGLKFDRWPAIATTEYQATIGGQLTLSGTLAAPHLNGDVDVLQGTIRPDLAFLTASAELDPDNTIAVIRPGQTQHQPAPSNAGWVLPESAPQVPSLFERLAMDINVRVSRDTWVKHDQAAVELEGRLRINKAPRDQVRIVGTITTVRGWIIYQQRRFDLQSGEIAFSGGKSIDPELNIDARYTLPDYVIDILVSGTAHHPLLQLKSQPELAQSDILALILFGKTTSALGQNEQQNLQQRAMQMASGYAASEIGRAVSQSLGLQDLGFQLSSVSSGGSAVGFGRYVTRNTYVSASEDQVQGRKVSLQYYLLRWLSVTTSTSSARGSEIDLNFRQQY